ncbi:hypothetical protein ACFLXL_01000 [Chloroflexota bacterium]
MRYIVMIALIVLGIYVFASLISGIGFSWMIFSENKFVLAALLGVAVSIATKVIGLNIVFSAFGGIIIGVLIYIFGSSLIELFKQSI